MDEVEATHWFWDTEIMVRAHVMALKLKRLRLSGKAAKTPKLTWLKDSWNMFRQIMGLWWKLKIKKK